MSASCPDCGATVYPAKVIGREEMVPLDQLPQMRGEGRYRVVSFADLTHEPVGPKEDVLAYPDHNITCPAKQRERERF